MTAASAGVNSVSTIVQPFQFMREALHGAAGGASRRVQLHGLFQTHSFAGLVRQQWVVRPRGPAHDDIAAQMRPHHPDEAAEARPIQRVGVVWWDRQRRQAHELVVGPCRGMRVHKFTLFELAPEPKLNIGWIGSDIPNIAVNAGGT